MLAACAAMLARPAEASAGLPGAEFSPLLVLPFLGLLLSMALVPVFSARLWRDHHGKIGAGWAVLLLATLTGAHGAAVAWHTLAQAMLIDYLPFIALMLALYAAGTGVLVKGAPVGTPTANTALLAMGTVLAGLVGTVAAALLLIGPLLRANAFRRLRTHTFVFFIFLVANIGGVLTPLGDPSLFLGLLRGVPFFWPAASLGQEVLFSVVALLAVFWVLDTLAWHREQPAAPVPERQERLGLEGWPNLALLAAAGAVVIGMGQARLGTMHILGQPVPVEHAAGIVLLLAIAFASARLTAARLREANGFGWGPMREVAKLFAAIFICVAPLLAMLRAGSEGAAAPLLAMVSDGSGQPVPWLVFWLTGALSAVMANAPAYLLGLHLAGGEAAWLVAERAVTLAALTCGAVFMGAASYIGNASNVMVRAIAEESGVRMPSFLGYCAWAALILLPLFVLLTISFF